MTPTPTFQIKNEAGTGIALVTADNGKIALQKFIAGRIASAVDAKISDDGQTAEAEHNGEKFTAEMTSS